MNLINFLQLDKKTIDLDTPKTYFHKFLHLRKNKFIINLTSKLKLT
jgi:hypothetical protein